MQGVLQVSLCELILIKKGGLEDSLDDICPVDICYPFRGAVYLSYYWSALLIFEVGTLVVVCHNDIYVNVQTTLVSVAIIRFDKSLLLG